MKTNTNMSLLENAANALITIAGIARMNEASVTPFNHSPEKEKIFQEAGRSAYRHVLEMCNDQSVHDWLNDTPLELRNEAGALGQLQEISKGLDIIETALRRVSTDDPSLAPFPLVGTEAGIHLAGQQSAYSAALSFGAFVALREHLKPSGEPVEVTSEAVEPVNRTMKTNTPTTALSMTGKEAVLSLKVALEKAGLPRSSSFNGAELTGWTRNYGSTGFSIRRSGENVTWHIVVSGRPHLTYAEEEMGRGEGAYDGYYPTNPEKLESKIADVFSSLGMKALSINANCWSTAWDDDVGYEIETNRPSWLKDSN